LTAIFKKFPEAYVGFVESYRPGANAQESTSEETRKNLDNAVGLVLEANRHLAEELLKDQQVIREPLHITVL